MDPLPDEFLQIRVGDIVCALLVLALVHRPIHTCLKERARGFISPRGDKFVEFVHVPFQVAPHETWAIFAYCAPEFKFLADKEDALLVS